MWAIVATPDPMPSFAEFIGAISFLAGASTKSDPLCLRHDEQDAWRSEAMTEPFGFGERCTSLTRRTQIGMNWNDSTAVLLGNSVMEFARIADLTARAKDHRPGQAGSGSRFQQRVGRS